MATFLKAGLFFYLFIMFFKNTCMLHFVPLSLIFCFSYLKSEFFCCARSTERPTGDLRERMKNKRQDVDSENVKRDLDEPTSPTVRVSL